jgi:PAS domain S-box-containing protein
MRADLDRRGDDVAFQTAQHQVLGMLASGASLPEVLDQLVRTVEQQSDGMLCSVVLLDDDGISVRHGAAPNLPPGYVEAINGLPIGPAEGSCGTAMYRGTRVIVTDILTDPLWEKYRGVAQRFNMRACWSTPIFSPLHKVLGSFAMYYDQPRAPDDRELRLIETAADIARIAIEQERAQQAVRDSEARNRAILRAIPDWMFVTTREGTFVDFHAKDASALHAPPSAFLGRRVTEILPPHVAEPLMLAFARVQTPDDVEKVEYGLGEEEDERFYEACIVACDGDKVLSIVRDITERKRAELDAVVHRRELAHLGRVAVLGELSGALAHELSQPLAAILSNAQAARHVLNRDAPDLESLRAMLDDIIRNDRRAGAVIDRLRALLRKSDLTLQPVDLNDIVREVLEFAYGELASRRVSARTCFTPAPAMVLGDRIQLQQVVLNLILNACDAMNGTAVPQRGLSLSTTACEGAIELVVKDRGAGIPPEELDRVFEPFVTFREQGLGMGLAISRSIVTAHGGTIRAENNPDRGATFRCRFPAVGPTPLSTPSH